MPAVSSRIPWSSAALRNGLLATHPSLVSYPQPDGGYKLAAGWLIDQCGFKGLDDGPVGVYGKQALVLIHHGGGTGAALLKLGGPHRRYGPGAFRRADRAGAGDSSRPPRGPLTLANQPKWQT